MLFIALYLAVPLVWLVLLCRQRRALNPDVSNSDPRLILSIRDHNPALSNMLFLFKDYNPDKVRRALAIASHFLALHTQGSP